MGCCMDTTTHFSSICTDTAWNWALALSFGFSASNPPPLACICKHDAHNCHHFKWDTPPPPSTTHNYCLTWQTWNQSIVAWFQVVSPQPPSPAHVCICNICDHHHFMQDTPPPPTSRVLPPNLLPCFVFVNVQCWHHHHLICTILPPFPVTPEAPEDQWEGACTFTQWQQQGYYSALPFPPPTHTHTPFFPLLFFLFFSSNMYNVYIIFK